MAEGWQESSDYLWVGSAGLLIAAKRRGLVDSVEQILQEWQAFGYRLDQSLIDKVMALSGETRD